MFIAVLDVMTKYVGYYFVHVKHDLCLFIIVHSVNIVLESNQHSAMPQSEEKQSEEKNLKFDIP